MKITIDIPEWAQKRHIYIMAGIEMLAYKLYGEDVVHIKTARCSRCGECCMNLGLGSEEPIGPDGNCIHLDKVGGQYVCGLHIRRPFGCSVGMQKKGSHPSCTVEYKEVKV